MSSFNSDGQMNLTVTDGSTYTGAQAADGSYYIVLNDGSTYTGLRHKSGGMNAIINETTNASSAPNGSIYVRTQSDNVGYTGSTALGGGTQGYSSLLGSDLYEAWDAARSDLMTVSGGLVSSWNGVVSGTAAIAAGTVRPAYSATSFDGLPGLTFDGVNDCLVTASNPFTGLTDFEVWAVCSQDALVADATSRGLVAFGGGASTATQFTMRRNVSGANRAQNITGNGASSVTATDLGTDLSGRHYITTRVTSSAEFVSVDGGIETTGAVVPSIAAGTVCIGGLALTVPAFFWQGQIALILVTKPLSATKRAALQALLLRRNAPNYTQQAQAIFTAMSVQPTTARKNIIDATVRKLLPIWSKLEVLRCGAVADLSHFVDWKVPTRAGTTVGTLFFEPDLGMAGDGVTGNLSHFGLGFTPSTDKTTLSTTSFGLLHWSGDGISGTDFGCTNARLRPRSSGSDNTNWQPNSNGNVATACFDGKGFWFANRTAAAVSALWYGNVSNAPVVVASDVQTNGALPAIEMWAFGSNHATTPTYAKGKMFWNGVTAGLTDPEVAILWGALSYYNTAVIGVASNVWSGALTDTSFRVTASLPYGLDTRLVVATDAAFTNIVSKGTVQSARATDKLGSDSWYGCDHTVTGLTPDTDYYFTLSIQSTGTLDLPNTGRVRTAPAAGVPKAFRIAFGSCTDLDYMNTMPAHDAVRTSGSLMFLQMDDQGYDNYVGNDIKAKRDPARFTRKYGNLPAIVKLNRRMPSAYIPGDHDIGDNDCHWDSDYSANSTTFDAVATNARKVYSETYPSYPFLQTTLKQGDSAQPILTQEFNIAAVRFILLDCYSQRRWSTGVGTVLGHTSGHEHWDQFTAICSRISRAALDGVKMLCLVFPTTLIGNVFEGYQTHADWQAEIKALLDYAKTVPNRPRLLFLNGDSHCLGIDKDHIDTSTGGGTGHLVCVVSSGMYQVPSAASGPYTVDGNITSTRLATDNRMVGLLDFSADNLDVGVTFMSSTGTAACTTVATYNTATIW